MSTACARSDILRVLEVWAAYERVFARAKVQNGTFSPSHHALMAVLGRVMIPGNSDTFPFTSDVRRLWSSNFGEMGKLCLVLLLATVFPLALSADESEWKSRTIYQILTDRFESGSGSPCSDLSSYCGGTWAGISKQLDYIQGN
jgi:hypothetical protein